DDDGYRQGALGADDAVLVDDRLQAAAQPEDRQPGADGLAHLGLVGADLAGEHQRVEPVQAGRRRGDLLPDPEREDIERQLGRGVYRYDGPWTPSRGSPYCPRHCAGSAYVRATSGIEAWKAVSTATTCGTSGSRDRVDSIAASACGTCSGASGAACRSAMITS